MLRSQRINLILLALVLPLLWWLLRQPAPPVPSASSRIPGPELGTIDHIRLERGGDDVVTLQRREGRWWMTTPHLWPANRIRVEQLLHLLQAPHYGSFNAQGLELGHYGLQPPQASLRLNDQLYRFGATEELNHHRYLLHRQTVYLVDDQYFYHSVAISDRYLSTRLLEAGSRITALSLPDLELTQEQGQWRSNRPEVYTDDLIALLQHWQTATALSVETAQGMETAGKSIITLRLQGKEEAIHFAIIQRRPDLLLLRLEQPLLYRFHPHQAQQLLEPGAQLTD